MQYLKAVGWKEQVISRCVVLVSIFSNCFYEVPSSLLLYCFQTEFVVLDDTYDIVTDSVHFLYVFTS